MQSFDKLLSVCKGEVTVFCNGHKAEAKTVIEYIQDWGEGDELEDIDPAVLCEMAKRDTTIHIQFYPNNASSFYTTWHYDLKAAVDEALLILHPVLF